MKKKPKNKKPILSTKSGGSAQFIKWNLAGGCLGDRNWETCTGAVGYPVRCTLYINQCDFASDIFCSLPACTSLIFFFLNLVCEQRTVLRAKSESQEELTGANDQEKKSISWSLNGPSGRPSGSGDCLRAAREREMTQGHSGKPKKKKKKKEGQARGSEATWTR